MWAFLTCYMCNLGLIHAVYFYLDGLFILLPLVQQCSILLYISIITSPLKLLQLKSCLMQRKEEMFFYCFSQQKAHFHFEFPEMLVSLLSPYKRWCFQCFSGGSRDGDRVWGDSRCRPVVLVPQTSQLSVLICCVVVDLSWWNAHVVVGLVK